MGRQKIAIKEIEDQRKKAVTFNKRKKGLYKKAMELSILTRANVLLVVLDESDALFEYCSNEDPRPLLRKYFSTAHFRHEKLNNSDYDHIYGSEESKKKKKKSIPLRSNPSLVHYVKEKGEKEVREVEKEILPPVTIEKKSCRKDVVRRKKNNKQNNNTDINNLMKYRERSRSQNGMETPIRNRDRVPYQYTHSTGFTPLVGVKTPSLLSMAPKKRYLGLEKMMLHNRHPPHPPVINNNSTNINNRKFGGNSIVNNISSQRNGLRIDQQRNGELDVTPVEIPPPEFTDSNTQRLPDNNRK